MTSVNPAPEHIVVGQRTVSHMYMIPTQSPQAPAVSAPTAMTDMSRGVTFRNADYSNKDELPTYSEYMAMKRREENVGGGEEMEETM